MFTNIRAIHLAVNSVEDALKDYADNFGLKAQKINTLPELGVKTAQLKVGDAVIEFIEPLEPGQGPIGNFLKNKGEGFFMTAMEVESLDSAIKDLKARGVPLINDDPESRKKGMPVFIHPKAARGLYIELIEMAKI